MKIFLDANVLVSVLNKEYPVFTYSARLLSLADSSKYKLYTSPLCIGIAFYFAEKKNGNANTRHKIQLLSSRINITSMSAKTVSDAIANKQVHDIEDGLQYYSALESGCKLIITEDKDDFYFSKIETLGSKEFMEEYIL